MSVPLVLYITPKTLCNNEQYKHTVSPE